MNLPIFQMPPMTDGTGYVSHSEMPNQQCQNCEHFVQSENGCNGPKMKAMSWRMRLADGNVEIEPYGWCKFWEME